MNDPVTRYRVVSYEGDQIALFDREASAFIIFDVKSDSMRRLAVPGRKPRKLSSVSAPKQTSLPVADDDLELPDASKFVAVEGAM